MGKSRERRKKERERKKQQLPNPEPSIYINNEVKNYQVNTPSSQTGPTPAPPPPAPTQQGLSSTSALENTAALRIAQSVHIDELMRREALLKQRLRDEQAENKRLRERLEQANDVIIEHVKDKKNLESQVASLTAMNASLTEQVERLRQENEELRKRVADLEKKNTTLEQKNDSLQQAVAFLLDDQRRVFLGNFANRVRDIIGIHVFGIAMWNDRRKRATRFNRLTTLDVIYRDAKTKEQKERLQEAVQPLIDAGFLRSVADLKTKNNRLVEMISQRNSTSHGEDNLDPEQSRERLRFLFQNTTKERHDEAENLLNVTETLMKLEPLDEFQEE